MRILTKFFVSVAVLMTAFSCVTDVTEDLGVELGGGASLTISLAESRTQLGEKVDGVYPVTWSAGDKVTLNGVAPASFTILDVDPSVATFTFAEDAAITYPYNIVYPAPADDEVEAVEAGCYPVYFLACQPYTVGSFCNEAAPMYGYAEAASETAISMTHLTGVLRFAVKGDGEKVRSLTVTTEGGKIAGLFDINCATGVLTPQDSATNTVIVSFEDGLVLGQTATPIYVAIPAGNYGKFTVVINTVNDRMTLAFDSTDQPIASGKVREFAEFTYTANDGVSDIFEITSAADMATFAQLVASQQSPVEAKVMNEIDMSGVEWAPIDGFTHTFNGNNQVIKGLSAPLFGATSGNIKDLTLKDVALVSNGRLVMGAVACNLYADGLGCAAISNCSVSGTITVNNPDFAPAAEYLFPYDVVNYGGVVGAIHGGVVSGCVNEAAITVEALAVASNETMFHASVGGVVGISSVAQITDGMLSSSVLNCENKGAINYANNATGLTVQSHIGGVVGAVDTNSTGDLKGCTNRGAITFNANAAGKGTMNIASTSSIGGIAGAAYGYIEDNNNYGTISVNGGLLSNFYLGGVVGITVPCDFVNCHNHTSGAITVDESVRFYSMTVTGVIAGYVRNGNVADEAIERCTNDAPITVAASSASDTAVYGENYYRVGGVVGYANNDVIDCENKANGDITVSGDIILSRNNDQSCYGVCGVLTYMTTSGYPYNLVNRGDINVYTNVTVHSGITDSDHCKLNIAGVAGYLTRYLHGGENYGNITIGKEGVSQSIAANGIYIGGIVSQGSVLTDGDFVNEGDITISSSTNLDGGLHYICIGGAVGRATGKTFDAVVNKGTISWSGTGTAASYSMVGGIAGLSEGSVATYTNCINYAPVSTTATLTSTLCAMGGLVGCSSKGKTSAFVNCQNLGDVTFDSEVGSHGLIGGIGGYLWGPSSFNNCHNKAVITIGKNAYVPNNMYFGGLCGYVAAVTLTNSSNSAPEGVEWGIVMSRTRSVTGGGAAVRMGGLVGYANGLTTTAGTNTNSAGIYVDGYQLGTAGLSIGGIIGSTNNSAHQYKGLIHNSGNLYYKGRCPKSNFGFAGCIATASTSASVVYGNIINTGNLTIEQSFSDTCPTSSGKSLRIGAITGNGGKVVNNAQSFCDFIFIDLFKATPNYNFFGLACGQPVSGVTVTNSKFGGRIALEMGNSVEDADGNVSVSPNYTTIATDNYYNYINVDSMTAEAAAAAGISVLSSASEIDYTVPEE